jgi:linoleoyl-CoA desaturase
MFNERQTTPKAAGAPVQQTQSSPRPTFNNNTEFHAALRRNVETYFESTGRRKRGNWQVYLKAAVILGIFFTSYLFLVFIVENLWQGLLSAIILALSMTGIGFNIMHDGGHRAFSERLWVNRMAAMTLDLIGVSSYMWHWKHAIYHHNYVNIAGYDPDMDLGVLARFAPYGKRLWFHRWQHLYIWFLYAFLVAKLQLFNDFHHFATGRIHAQPMPRPKHWDLVIFVTGKAIFFTIGIFVSPSLPPGITGFVLLRSNRIHDGYTPLRRFSVAALHGPLRSPPAR